jgi:hypothetical protein
MQPTYTSSPQIDLERFQQVSAMAASRIGGILLLWSSMETIMRIMTLAVRAERSAQDGTYPPSHKMSHRPMERTNEWIRTVMPVSDAYEDAEVFREEFRKLKTVRDNLAHNIEFPDEQGGTFFIQCFWDRKEYEAERDAWWKRVQEEQYEGPPPEPYERVIYDDARLQETFECMQSLLKVVLYVHSAEGLPRPTSMQDVEQMFARPDLRPPAKPKDGAR